MNVEILKNFKYYKDKEILFLKKGTHFNIDDKYYSGLFKYGFIKKVSVNSKVANEKEQNPVKKNKKLDPVENNKQFDAKLKKK